MRARLRGPGGASTISLANDATVGDLIAQIIEKTAISSFDIKYGYPPRPLDLNQNETARPLKELDVKLDGEQLIVSPKETPAVQQPSQETSTRENNASASSGQTQKKGDGPIALQKKAMEGDVPEVPMPERGATLGKGFPKLATKLILTFIQYSG
jgi:ubiquitin thioesterase OTU1